MIERRSRKAASRNSLFALAVLILISSGACAVATPLCDEGRSLIDSAQLDRGTEAYALARHEGEGDCADTGLSVAGDRYTDAYVAVARGRAAENRHDVEAAVSAYEAAIAFDVDNPAAREALARLQRPVPELRPPAPLAPPPAVQPLSPWTTGLIGAAVVLLAMSVGLLLWLAWTWRGYPKTFQRGDEQASERHAAVERCVKAVESRVDGVAEEVRKVSSHVVSGLGEQTNALGGLRSALASTRRELARMRDDVDQATARRASALERHLDDIVDALTDLLNRRGEPSSERFVEPRA